MPAVDTPVIVALITAGSSALTIILTQALTHILKIREAKRLAALPPKNEMDASIAESDEVYPLLLELEMDYDRATGVSVVQFHNGGSFYSGGGIQRMTMTYELPARRGDRMRRDLQGIILSGEQRQWLKQVQAQKDLYYPDTSLLPEGEMKDFFLFYHIASISVTPLQDDLGRLIGMLWLTSTENDFRAGTNTTGLIYKGARLQRLLIQS